MCGVGASALLIACTGDSSSGTDADTTDSDNEAEAAVDCSGTSGTVVGAETDFPVGTWTLVQQFIVAQDANGFFAYSAICTHQGCLVNSPDSTGTALCICHGSEFDGNGNVIAGPAFQPLAHFAVNICGGSVYVDKTQRVNGQTRTPPA
jgi:Rieske Fe-S protein